MTVVWQGESKEPRCYEINNVCSKKYLKNLRVCPLQNIESYTKTIEWYNFVLQKKVSISPVWIFTL